MAGDNPTRGEPPNDALLVQLVRGAIGRRPGSRGWPRINVSSCSLEVTLHGLAGDARQRGEIEAVARAVRGVREVHNKMGVVE